MDSWRGEEVTGIVVALRLILGAMLVFSGVEKLCNLQGFVAGVIRYKILPAGLAGWYGRLLPIVELGTGVFLILGIQLKPTSIISTAMFASFAIAVTINLLRKSEMPCYCFGADARDKMGWHTLVRIVLLFTASMALILYPAVPDPIRTFIHHPSMVSLVELVPLIAISIFGLLFISLLETYPWVVRAWIAPAIRPPCRSVSYTWIRESEEERMKVA
jgi:putative oxidoreductase